MSCESHLLVICVAFGLWAAVSAGAIISLIRQTRHAFLRGYDAGAKSRQELTR